MIVRETIFSQNSVAKGRLKCFFSQTTIVKLFTNQSELDILPAGCSANMCLETEESAHILAHSPTEGK